MNRAAGGRNRLTARDYKGSQPRALNLRRLRDFAWGAAAGIAAASVLWVYSGTRLRHVEEPAAPRPDPHRSAHPDGETPAATEHYDFYKMLPNFEVVVPEKDKDVKRDLTPTAKIERPGVYVLQAGSYRNEADANRVRAQLALQGVEAKVQRVAVDADVWHRVRVGPISNLEELNRLRRQLQAAEVDALVIRVGD
ncbi:MAG: SPOR domain-containing protein [Gammaproteobacteria bacterium]|nr:SPOR domain-containing protein [Gammaproteobacteria bacterium]MBV9695298.1 SPOR domain-containing protein [Gammaproteobacteria bacterium]